MKNDLQNATDKKKDGGNGNSVINNYERSRNCSSDYVSGDAAPSSCGHKFQNSNKK